MYITSICIILLACLATSAYGCGMGGIGAPTSGAVIALVIILTPIVVPVGIVPFLAYKGIQKVNRKIKQNRDVNHYRRRNSDVFKTQMSRAVKKVGREAFDNHIQTLFNRVKDYGNDPIFSFELGVALFLTKDLLGAEQHLTKAISMGNDGSFDHRLGHAYFVRGLVNQYLWDFKQAIQDFDEAAKLFKKNPPQAIANGAEPDNTPQLSELDALNSYGFAHALRALYGVRQEYAEDYLDNEQRVQLLDIAIDSYDEALERVSIKQGMWYHNRGVARYFRTYYDKDLTEAEIRAEVELALQDFESAVNSGNFGTAADGYAMIAQCKARLSHKFTEEEISMAVAKALDIDPKVFMVDVTVPEELSEPWPLPRHEFPFKKSAHVFEKVHFNKPTWCNHCMGFIKNPVGKQGYECTQCGYKVHSQCFPQVKSKNCYSASLEETLDEPKILHGVDDDFNTISDNHTHHFKPCHFHKPTWCQHCTKFVSSPFGKQGYTCADCGFKVHKDCVALVGRSFVDK